MNGIVEFVFETMALWSIETTLLVLLALFFCRRLKNQPGGIHAAIWTVTLILIWSLPIAPRAIPSAFHFRLLKPEIIQVNVGRTPPPASRTSSPLQRPFAGTDNNRIEKPSVLPPSSDRPSTLNGRGQQEESLAASSKFSWRWSIDLVLGLWMVGVGCSIRHWMRAEKNVHRLISRSSEIEDRAIRSSVERTRQILFIHESIRLRAADAQTAPFVIGLFRPTIFIPNYMIEEWPQRDHQAVIAHELAHVRRYDLVSHHAMRLLRIVFWFLPPVGWMQRELHHTQDAACDECAAVVLGSGAKFGRALTQLAEYCLITDPAFPALGILHSKPSLIIRLENIMNARLNTLSRLSLKWKFSLTTVSIGLFLFAGLVQPAISQQKPVIDYLGNYSGERGAIAVEAIAYAAPYYALIGWKNDRAVIQYYQMEKDVWVEKFSVYLSSEFENTNTMSLAAVAANDRYTLIFYNQMGEIQIDAVNHNSSNPMRGTIGIENLIEALCPVINQNELLFVGKLKDQPNQYLFRCSLDGENLDFRKYDLPEISQMRIVSFCAFPGGLLFVDGNGSPDDPAGTSRAGFTEDGQLEIEKERLDIVGDLMARGTDVFIHKINTVQISVVDWSKTNSPTIVQTINSNQAASLSGTQNNMAVWGERVALPSRSKDPEKPGTDLYRKNQDRYEKIVSIPNAKGTIALGPDYLMSLNSTKITTFDIRDPQNPVEIPFPLPPIVHSGVVSAVPGGMVYAIDSREDGHYLLTLDAAVPGNTRIVEERPYPPGETTGFPYESFQAHHGMVCLKTREDFALYEIQPNGLLGDPVIPPPVPAGKSKTSLKWIDYNDRLYLQSFNVSQDQKYYPQVFIHARAGKEIGAESLGTLSLSTQTTRICLSDNRLYELVEEIERDVQGTSVTMLIQNYINAYSLDDPSRPVLLSKYQIPLPEDKSSGLSISKIAAWKNYLSYSGKYSGVIDMNDPKTPIHFQPRLPFSHSMFWTQNVLGVPTPEGIFFYQVREDHSLAQIATIPGQYIMVYPSSLDDRIYIPCYSLGIDTYQLKLVITNVLNWNLY